MPRIIYYYIKQNSLPGYAVGFVAPLGEQLIDYTGRSGAKDVIDGYVTLDDSSCFYNVSMDYLTDLIDEKRTLR